MAPERYLLRQPARIEGGVDVVVIGGDLEGLVAAGLCAKAGMRTILLEDGLRLVDADREEFSPGFFCDRNECLIDSLDAAAISLLDLYRHGLSFAERRVETTYHCPGGARLVFGGDPATAHERLGDIDPDVAANLDAIMTEMLALAGRIGPAFFNADAEMLVGAGPWATTPLETLIVERIGDESLRAAFRAEGALGQAARASDPYSGLNLIRRFAGETAGLMGAIGAIEGGVRALADAARRAAQGYGVEFRQAAAVSGVAIEWDAAAGVALSDGGQIRTSAVITAHDATTAFATHVGRDRLDIEFLHALDRPGQIVMTADAAIALEFSAGEINPFTDEMRQRHVIAQASTALARAQAAARRDEASPHGVVSFYFPSAFAPDVAPPKGALMKASLTPVGAGASQKAARAAVEAALLARFPTLESAMIDISATMSRATPPALIAADRARLVTSADRIGGYFFCGPESRAGGGLSGASGRIAAEAAVRYLKKGRRDA